MQTAIHICAKITFISNGKSLVKPTKTIIYKNMFMNTSWSATRWLGRVIIVVYFSLFFFTISGRGHFCGANRKILDFFGSLNAIFLKS